MDSFLRQRAPPKHGRFWFQMLHDPPIRVVAIRAMALGCRGHGIWCSVSAGRCCRGLSPESHRTCNNSPGATVFLSGAGCAQASKLCYSVERRYVKP